MDKTVGVGLGIMGGAISTLGDGAELAQANVTIPDRKPKLTHLNPE
jgi:hypothetical protein